MVCLIPEVFHDVPGIVAVGGAVRDYVMGFLPQDIDLASPLRPEEITRWAKAKGLKVVPTGIDHGTVTILTEDSEYEHTTFRKDVSCDGRNATVEFSTELEDDLARRDFTCNAMAMTVSGEIIDLHSGQDDIRRRILRTVGLPQLRFVEDYLRIIRAVRFAARFNWSLDEATWSAAVSYADRIMKHVSVERVTEEFNKAFQHQGAGRFLHGLFFMGVLKHIIPEYETAVSLMQNPLHHPEGDVWRHVCDTVDRCEPEYRWHAFLHDVGKPATAERSDKGPWYSFYGHAAVGAAIVRTIASRLKWPNELLESVSATTALHCLPMEFAQTYGNKFPDKCCRKLRHRAGQHFDALKAVVMADSGDTFEEEFGNLFREIAEPIKPVLMGRHLIAAGLRPSNRMGELLLKAFEIQLEEGIFEPDELVKRVYGMTRERYGELERSGEAVSAEESALGWHYCMEWDYLLVGPGMPELDACSCIEEKE